MGAKIINIDSVALKKVFTSKQMKLKNRLDLSMNYWFKHGLFVYWITVTSSPESVDGSHDLRLSWHQLMQAMRREFDMEHIEYVTIETDEGYGVYHAFIVLDKRLPMCQAWMSRKWSTFHGAFRVWINELGNKGKNDAAKITWYSVTQYASNGQGSSFIKARWSRFTFLPRPALDYFKLARRGLRDFIYPFQPWKINYRMVNDFALAMVLGEVWQHAGFILMLGMTGVEVLDTVDNAYIDNQIFYSSLAEKCITESLKFGIMSELEASIRGYKLRG